MNREKNAMSDDYLTDMDYDVLDMLVNGRTHWSGTGTEIVWGAAMSVIIEHLHNRRLVSYPNVKVTDAGRAALHARMGNEFPVNRDGQSVHGPKAFT